MPFIKSQQKSNQRGFTLVETITYLFIFSMLMLLISSLVTSVFNAKRMLQSSDMVHNNARFIANFLTHKIHNTDLINDVSPEPEGFYFYQMPDTRFSIAVESNNLVFREVQDIGDGFPDQSTADPIVLNTDRVSVSNLVLTPVADSHSNQNQGLAIDFTLTTGNVNNIYNYLQKDFSIFISIR